MFAHCLPVNTLDACPNGTCLVHWQLCPSFLLALIIDAQPNSISLINDYALCSSYLVSINLIAQPVCVSMHLYQAMVLVQFTTPALMIPAWCTMCILSVLVRYFEGQPMSILL